MGMRKIRKSDEVIVITGKDRGRRGLVQKILPNNRIIVDDINIVKKHVKPKPQSNEPRGIVEQERSIDISNVMLYNSQKEKNEQKGKGDRIGFKTLEDKRKVRIFKNNAEVVDTI